MIRQTRRCACVSALRQLLLCLPAAKPTGWGPPPLHPPSPVHFQPALQHLQDWSLQQHCSIAQAALQDPAENLQPTTLEADPQQGVSAILSACQSRLQPTARQLDGLKRSCLWLVRKGGAQVGGVQQVQQQDVEQALSLAMATCGFTTKQMLKLVTKRPSLLFGSLEQQALPMFQQMVHMGGEPGRLRRLLLDKPQLLDGGLKDFEDKVHYFKNLGLPDGDLISLWTTHPAVSVAPLRQVSGNVAFWIGVGLKPEEILGLLRAAPDWLLFSLTELTVKWQFFRQEVKGAKEDLVLFPTLLDKDIIEVLGPRTGFARKKRLKLLMPSYTHGNTLWQDPASWREYRMIPLAYYVDAAPEQFCETMGYAVEEYTRYKACWIMTTGLQWRRLLKGGTDPRAQINSLRL